MITEVKVQLLYFSPSYKHSVCLSVKVLNRNETPLLLSTQRLPITSTIGILKKQKKHERSFSLVTPAVSLITTKNGKDELSFDTTLTPENFQTFVIHMQWLKFPLITIV